MGAYEQFYRMSTIDDEDGVIDTPPAREPFRLLIDDEARRQVIAEMLGRYGPSRRKENFSKGEDGEEDLTVDYVSSEIATV